MRVAVGLEDFFNSAFSSSTFLHQPSSAISQQWLQGVSQLTEETAIDFRCNPRSTFAFLPGGYFMFSNICRDSSGPKQMSSPRLEASRAFNAVLYNLLMISCAAWGQVTALSLQVTNLSSQMMGVLGCAGDFASTSKRENFTSFCGRKLRRPASQNWLLEASALLPLVMGLGAAEDNLTSAPFVGAVNNRP